MEFLGADSDFGAVAEFEAVGEAGGGVDVDHRCVDFVQEFLGVGVVVGDDRLGVFCVVAVDVRDRFVDRGNRFNGYDIVEILFSPVLFCRCFCSRHVFSCLLVCAHLHLFLFQSFCENRQQFFTHVFMHYDGFTRIADADTLCLCTQNNINRHRKICRLIDIDMAVSGSRLDNRDGTVFHYSADQSGTAARNQNIDIAVHLHKLCRCLT